MEHCGVVRQSYLGHGSRPEGQDSLDNLVSSIFISLNSLASKTSPHSWHSTNSESSSRATMRTRGCWHGSALFGVAGIWGGLLDVINPEWLPLPKQAGEMEPEICRILDRTQGMSSPLRDPRWENTRPKMSYRCNQLSHRKLPLNADFVICLRGVAFRGWPRLK